MKISTTQFALFLLVTMMAACKPILASPVSPMAINTFASSLEPAPLPDLIIKFVYLEMAGRQSNCVASYTPYEIRVLVENIGSASTGPFVVDLNSTQQRVDEGLAAGKRIELYFAGTIPSGRYEATVDSINQVSEREEDNNTLSFLAPTPTPPPLCTATPTPIPR